MPLYEYRCDQCSHQFERLVRARSAKPKCSQCDSEQVTRLISSGGFILKGGGWANEGYSKGGKENT